MARHAVTVWLYDDDLEALDAARYSIQPNPTRHAYIVETLRLRLGVKASRTRSVGATPDEPANAGKGPGTRSVPPVLAIVPRGEDAHTHEWRWDSPAGVWRCSTCPAFSRTDPK